MSASMTSSPIVRDLIERRARALAEERPWASHEDNMRRAEDLLRGEFAPKPQPIPRAETVMSVTAIPKERPTDKRVRRRAPVVEQVTMVDGSQAIRRRR